MNRLGIKIAQRIRREGPLSIAAFMAMALHDPADGYYARREPIGRAGDFITAPEISQIFGELIGLCCADWWQRADAPDPVIVAELGPGRGTLMVDFLRATSGVPGFRQAIRLHLIEASPMLRAEQQRRLDDARPQFVESIGALPDEPLLLVANEFLDALPVRQLVRGAGNDWAERFVGLDEAGQLAFVDGPASVMLGHLVPPELRGSSSPGAVVEVCSAAAALASVLGERLSRRRGCALFVDYGYDGGMPGATLAAIRGHRPAFVFEAPGEADLSAHVDFAAFTAAARAAGAAVYGPVPQGRFLAALGAEARLARLLERAATPTQRDDLRSGLARLLDPAAMGTLFEVLAITSPGQPAPAGFD